MKNLKLVAVAFFGMTSLISCDNDNEVIVNEEEVITTVTTTLTNGTSVITLLSRDLDGDGPNAPVVTVSGILRASKVYTGRVTILNETETPAGDITAEVKGEGEEHQLFFQVPSVLGTFMYTDVDINGRPIGLEFTLTTKTASTGSLVVTLRHLPNKSASGVANGDITNAGGATDFAVTYPLVVE